MDLNIEKIKNIILQEEDLSETEQQDLVALFSQESDARLEQVVQLFSENPSWIKRVNDNYQAKKKAFQKNDKDAWAKIMQDEESLLTKIEQN